VWLNGGYAARGPMAQDITDTRLLIGKTKADVEKLLGQPNYRGSYRHTDAYAYNARTSNLRCYFVWECRLSVAFDKTSVQVTSVSLSD